MLTGNIVHLKSRDISLSILYLFNKINFWEQVEI